MLCGSYKALSVCTVWLASTEVQKSNTCMFIVSGLPVGYISLVTTNTMPYDLCLDNCECFGSLQAFLAPNDRKGIKGEACSLDSWGACHATIHLVASTTTFKQNMRSWSIRCFCLSSCRRSFTWSGVIVTVSKKSSWIHSACKATGGTVTEMNSYLFLEYCVSVLAVLS